MAENRKTAKHCVGFYLAIAIDGILYLSGFDTEPTDFDLMVQPTQTGERSVGESAIGG